MSYRLWWKAYTSLMPLHHQVDVLKCGCYVSKTPLCSYYCRLCAWLWCQALCYYISVKTLSSLGGLEPPTFRLTAERANRLRHRDHVLQAVFISKQVQGVKRLNLHIYVSFRDISRLIQAFPLPSIDTNLLCRFLCV